MKKKNSALKEAGKTAAAVGAGAGVGAGAQAIIGGVGVAVAGTAVALPLVIVGASLGALVWIGYKVGKSRRKK